MIKNMVEEHHKETPRGHLLRADIPGPGKVLARYLENGEQTWEEYESNPNKRCVVNVPTNLDKVKLIRPNLYRLHNDIKQIDTIDTSNPIMAAFDGDSYQNWGLNRKPKTKIDEVINSEFNSDIFNTIKHNTTFFKYINNIT